MLVCVGYQSSAGLDRALSRGLELGGALADAVLIRDRTPACRAAFADPPNAASGLSVPEQPEHLVAAPASLVCKRGRGELAVLGQQRLETFG